MCVCVCVSPGLCAALRCVCSGDGGDLLCIGQQRCI